MEAPSPPLRLDDSLPSDGAPRPELEATALGRSIASELAAIVTEFECSKTLETGLGRGGSALAIATVHEHRGRGGHIAIDPNQESVFSSDGLERLRRAGLLHRVQLIASSSEVALPELLRDGTELDFALIQGPKRFEDAFVEFLYLDRMLVTEGVMALAGGEERAAVLEYIAQTRAYELRSKAGSELTVLRKLGQQRTQQTPFPSSWGRPGERTMSDRNLVTQSGGVVTSAGDVRRAAIANGALLNAPSTRELHLARTRTGELEARVAELGAGLLDAEQRAAELLRTRARIEKVELELLRTRARIEEVELELRQAKGKIGELSGQLSLSEGAHQRAEHWLACVNSSASWRLTAPLRTANKGARALFRR